MTPEERAVIYRARGLPASWHRGMDLDAVSPAIGEFVNAVEAVRVAWERQPSPVSASAGGVVQPEGRGLTTGDLLLTAEEARDVAYCVEAVILADHEDSPETLATALGKLDRVAAGGGA